VKKSIIEIGKEFLPEVNFREFETKYSYLFDEKKMRTAETYQSLFKKSNQ
jgi:hypothetical protein